MTNIKKSIYLLKIITNCTLIHILTRIPPMTTDWRKHIPVNIAKVNNNNDKVELVDSVYYIRDLHCALLELSYGMSYGQKQRSPPRTQGTKRWASDSAKSSPTGGKND